MRIAVSLVVSFGIITLFSIQLHDFQTRQTTIDHASELPSTAIVFTGQFDRIVLALDLFDQRRIDRLFISGANPGAGMGNDFANQFHVSETAMSGLAEGKIILATQANTTLENALETACWLKNVPTEREVLLITGRLHLARASLALQRAIDVPITIVRISPEKSARSRNWKSTINEFHKFFITTIITLLPQQWWTQKTRWKCE